MTQLPTAGRRLSSASREDWVSLPLCAPVPRRGGGVFYSFGAAKPIKTKQKMETSTKIDVWKTLTKKLNGSK